MLHVTTDVGKVGRKERERRHFPQHHNLPSEPAYKSRGRRYIPHNYGTDMDWVPHGQYIEPEPTESGPDWSSRLRYLPDPENPDYPAAEIWPNNWHSMRPYPYWEADIAREREHFFGDRGKRKIIWTYKRSDNEWLLDPGLTKVGLRCVFNGEHRATATSENEITHTMLYGKGRPEYMVDKRNELTEASPGDKSYQVPEYSPSFHNVGSTRPAVRYGEPFKRKEMSRQQQQEIDEVKRLENWKPATPLPLTLPIVDEKNWDLPETELPKIKKTGKKGKSR